MAKMMAEVRTSGQEEDYSEIEFYLRQAQDEIGQALSVLSPEGIGGSHHTVTKDTSAVTKDTPQVTMDTSRDHCSPQEYHRGYYSLGHPRKKSGLKLNCRTPNKDQNIVDFHSIFSSSSDTVDEDFFRHLETPECDRSWSTSTLPGSTPAPRPHRPQTLTPPISLPKCCNFRRRDWRFYISGNFNTDVISDLTEYVDPLDSLLSDNRSSLGSAATTTSSDIKFDKSHKYYIPSPVTTSDSKPAIVEDLDSEGKKVYTFTVSTTIDAPKASSTYQSLSSSTSDGSSTKFPIEKRSTDDEADSKRFPQKETLDSVKPGSKSVDNIADCAKSSTSSLDYVSTRWIIKTHEDMTQSTPALSQAVERTMADKGSISAETLGVVTMPTLGMVRENPEGSSDSQSEEKSRSSPVVNGSMEKPLLSPRSPRIKTNGLLMSPKKTLREKRLRVRSDPSRMLTERVQLRPGVREACVQTESMLDGMLSPPVTRHSSPARDEALIRRSTSSSPDREDYHVIPPPLPAKHEYRLKSSSSLSSSSSSVRHRSQSADRVERTPQRVFRPRNKSESPDRRRTRSPVKLGCGDKRCVVSKVSRSTQTHRSIVRYGSTNKAAVSQRVSSPPPSTTSTKPTIHVQLDDVLRKSMPDGAPNVDQVNSKNEASSLVKVSAVKEFKPSRPGVTVISSVKGDKQSAEEQSITVIKCENIGKQPRKTKKSSKSSKMASSASNTYQHVEEDKHVTTKTTQVAETAVIYVPSRESRRIHVRPPMPAIAEDSQRQNIEEDDDDDASSTLSSSHRKSIHYYSLKTEKTTMEDKAISSSTLSKSANDVTTDKQQKGSSNSLLDTLHRKYYPKQYNPATSKSHSVERLPEPAVKNGVSEFVKMSDLYKNKNKLSSPDPVRSNPSQSPQPPLRIPMDPPVGPPHPADQGSSPSPEETRGDQQEEFLFECCDHVTPECDIKSFQKLMKTDRECAEIEALEACSWLRAAGFPQYAQMYEENQFPISVATVEKDHDFLDTDSMHSLFRRLNTLNKCVSMKIEAPPRKTNADDSDDEEPCALSDKWRYQRSSRRWSRADLEDGVVVLPAAHDSGDDKLRSCSSHDSVITDNEESVDSPRSPDDTAPLSPTAFKRSASEKFKLAKNTIFKRMESLKSASVSRKSSVKNKKQPMGKLEIGSPVLVESRSVAERMDRLGCKDISTSPSLSTGSRGSTGVHDTTADSDSVFTGDEVEVVVRSADKRRNRSESAVSELITDTSTDSYSVEASPPIKHNTQTTYKPRSSSFSVVTNGNHHPGYTRTHSDTRLEANNNNDKPSSPRDPEYRLSVYDNVPPDAETGAAVKELDLIVQNLMQDISELNASWGGLPVDEDGMDTFPADLTLEDALKDLSSDRDNTLTRKSHQNNNKNLAAIPAHRATDNHHSSSRSSSSSTISHSNSSSLPQFDSFFDPSEIFSPGSASRITGGRSTCEDSDSSHVHVMGMDETLDAILRNLESHYTPVTTTTMTSHDNNKHVDANKNVVVEPEQDSTSLSDPDLTSDPLTPGSREDDEDDEGHGPRERRDSGVGSSLTREPSDRRRYRIRWHSFVKSHRPSFNSRDLQINCMSAGQLKLLRKFSLLKITALMEKYSLNRSGWNWAMPMNKLMRRFKVAADYKDRAVFGVPLQLVVQRTGQALPQCMLHAMRCLRKNAHDSVGIFRKSGVRSRIQKLRDQIEADPENVAFDMLQAYDVADLLKQYFRELPECLLTNKLSETFISIFTHVPLDQRLEALYSAVMLLPDENREVLQSLLLFLSDMADYAQQNQMNASNLAVCFAPSLFHLCGSRGPAGASPKRSRKKEGIPDQRELQEQKAAHECLTEMILHCKQIFMVPSDTLRMCHFSYMDQCSPVSLGELGRRGRSGDDRADTGDYMAYLESCIQGLLKESRDKFKGWVSVSSHTAVDLAYKKIDDGYSLRLWKCSVDVEAPPPELLNRVCRERQLWDEDFLKWRVAESLDQNTEVFQYVLNSLAPHPTRDFCELRHWRSDLPKGACVLVSTSVEHHQGETPLMGGVTGVVLASRYLIEPCGAGKSRLTHISRVDLRGHTPEWYNKVYGHLCANLVCRIRDSFSQRTEGPETNV